jgi:adenine deaminase
VLGTDPAAMARAAARVVEMGGGFAFDGGWSAPLEIDGLIASGGYERALRIERELTEAMLAAGYPFHDPLYSLLFASGDFLPEIRLTPVGVLEVKSRTVLAPALRYDRGA